MYTPRVLRTEGDPLLAIQKLLHDIWVRAGLAGILVPRRPPGSSGLTMVLAQERGHFSSVDPFAPVMADYAAQAVAELARQHPRTRYAAVLRPCEVRALFRLALWDSFRPDNILIIGVDCLATFPAEDYRWRVEKWHGGNPVTREALRFARQGGILAYRDRPACQMCVAPMPDVMLADLRIGVLGLPTQQLILVTARDETVARRLDLGEITDGPAPPTLIEQHERMRFTLAERRAHTRERMIRDLPANLPKSVEDVIAHLRHCAPCQASARLITQSSCIPSGAL